MMIVSPSKSIRTMMNTGKIFLKSSLSAAGKAATASVVATLFSLCHAVEKDVVVIVSHKSQGGMTHAPSITRYFALHQGGDTISRNR